MHNSCCCGAVCVSIFCRLETMMKSCTLQQNLMKKGRIGCKPLEKVWPLSLSLSLMVKWAHVMSKRTNLGSLDKPLLYHKHNCSIYGKLVVSVTPLSWKCERLSVCKYACIVLKCQALISENSISTSHNRSCNPIKTSKLKLIRGQLSFIATVLRELS